MRRRAPGLLNWDLQGFSINGQRNCCNAEFEYSAQFNLVLTSTTTSVFETQLVQWELRCTTGLDLCFSRRLGSGFLSRTFHCSIPNHPILVCSRLVSYRFPTCNRQIFIGYVILTSKSEQNVTSLDLLSACPTTGDQGCTFHRLHFLFIYTHLNLKVRIFLLNAKPYFLNIPLPVLFIMQFNCFR